MFDDHVMESSSRQESQRTCTSPKIPQQNALMCHPVNDSNSEWLPKDERVSKNEQESSGHNLEPIISNDMLKQLILPESKLKQNKKVLKEFEEQRVIRTTNQRSCVENPVKVFKPLPLNSREGTNPLDEDINPLNCEGKNPLDRGINPLDGHGSEQLDHKSSSEGDESEENCKKDSAHSMEYTNTKIPIINESPKTEEDPISDVVKACTIRHQV